MRLFVHMSRLDAAPVSMLNPHRPLRSYSELLSIGPAKFNAGQRLTSWPRRRSERLRDLELRFQGLWFRLYGLKVVHVDFWGFLTEGSPLSPLQHAPSFFCLSWEVFNCLEMFVFGLPAPQQP